MRFVFVPAVTSETEIAQVANGKVKIIKIIIKFFILTLKNTTSEFK